MEVSHELLMHEEKHARSRSDMTNLLQSQQVIVAFAAFALAAVCYQYSELMGVGASGIRDKSMAPWPKPGEEQLPRATFAAGCFWGPELHFQRVPGVVSTAVGYTGGKVDNPTYEQVCSGRTGHTEAIELTYNPDETNYEQLVKKFYDIHDPTTLNRQKGDAGTQYRSGIYYRSDEEKQIAEAAKAKVPGAVTELAQLKTFYPAEAYHQQYLEKGGRGGRGQSAAKMCNDPVRCYG